MTAIAYSMTLTSFDVLEEYFRVPAHTDYKVMGVFGGVCYFLGAVGGNALAKREKSCSRAAYLSLLCTLPL